MKKFNFNKKYNKNSFLLHEAFDFGKEIEDINFVGLNDETNSIANLLYYHYTEIYKLLLPESILEIINWCLSTLNSEEKIKKGLIDFYNCFIKTKSWYIWENAKMFELLENYGDSTEISDDYMIGYKFNEIYKKIKPNPDTCSEEAIALAFLLNHEDSEYVINITGTIDWTYHESDDDVGYRGGPEIESSSLDTLSLNKVDPNTGDKDELYIFKFWEYNQATRKYKLIEENKELYDAWSFLMGISESHASSPDYDYFHPEPDYD